MANLLSYLLESELALHVNPVAQEGGRVTWQGHQRALPFLRQRRVTTVDTYRGWLEASSYSAVLYDGALLQITYDFAAGMLIGHRLAWVPCPVNLDEDLLQEAPLLEVFDASATSASDVWLRSILRFEFEPEAVASGHPASHFTVNAVECRIACPAPMRLGHFVDFVFRNFYPQHWRAHPYLDRLSRQAWLEHTLADDDRGRPHLMWPHQ